MEEWSELKPKIERICLRRGIPKVAADIPANRATVYRLLNSETAKPSRAGQSGIARIVNAETENQS